MRALQGTRFAQTTWPFWFVTVLGGHDPVRVATEWSLVDVYDAYYSLRVKSAMGGG